MELCRLNAPKGWRAIRRRETGGRDTSLSVLFGNLNSSNSSRRRGRQISTVYDQSFFFSFLTDKVSPSTFSFEDLFMASLVS